MKKHIIKLWPLIIFTFALAARFAFLADFEKNPFFYPKISGLDPSLYHNWAKELSRGYWPGESLLYGHPLYPYVMSFIYKAFGPDAYPVAVFQFLLGSLSCVFIYLIARRLFCPGAGIISSLIAALYGPFLFYEGLLVPHTLAVFLTLSALLALLIFERGLNLYLLFLAGVLLGCSALTNSASVPFVFLAAVWVFFKTRGKAPLKYAVYLVLAVLAPAALFSFKYFAAEGRFDSFGSHGGINFYIGNNAQATGAFAAPFGFTPTAEGLSSDSFAYARKAAGRPLSAAEASLFWYKKAFGWIKAHPFAWLGLLSRKFTLFWNSYEIGDAGDYYLSKSDSVLLGFNPLVFGVVAPLGLLGIVLARRRRREAFLLYAALAGFMFSCLLFFVNSRYRALSAPFLIIFAGFAVWRAWQGLFKKAFLRVGVYAVVFLAFFAFSNQKVQGVDSTTPLYNLSVLYVQNGSYDKAIELSDIILRQRPGMALAHFNLGVCFYKKNAIPLAIAGFQQALRLKPDYGPAYFNLGIIYYGLKEYKKAEENFELSLAADNNDPVAHYCLAGAYRQQGRLKDALEEYKAAVRIAPDFTPALAEIRDLSKMAKEAKN